MTEYHDAAHEAYRRLVAARRPQRPPSPEEQAESDRRAKAQTDTPRIKRRLPKVA